MTQVGIRQLADQTSAVLRTVESGEPVVVTKQGTPVVVIVPLSEEDVEVALTRAAVDVAHRLIRSTSS